MEETITVKELITQLLEKDMNKKVIASSVGFNADCSYDYPLSLGNITVIYEWLDENTEFKNFRKKE